MPQDETPAEPGPRILDARSLRGLAHPLRMQLLKSLRHDGPATASQLAQKLGESSGATSYHLRQLAAHDFIEDSPEHGKGRERWWRAAQQGTAFDENLLADPDPSVRGAADVFLHELATMHFQELSTWLGTRGDWAPEWIRSSDMSDFTLRLTAARTYELTEKIHDLIESYRDLEAPADDSDAAQVRYHLHSFPRS